MKYIKTIFDLWQLKKNEKKSVEEISSLQTKKLKRLLHYAYEHSVYYRGSFERAGITAEMIDSAPLSSFPTMDKSVLMSQFEEIITVPDLTQGEIRNFDERETTGKKLFKDKFVPIPAQERDSYEKVYIKRYLICLCACTCNWRICRLWQSD